MNPLPLLNKPGAKPKAVKLPQLSLKSRALCNQHLSTAQKMLKGSRPERYSEEYLRGVAAAFTWMVSENGTAEPPVRWSYTPWKAKKEVNL